MSPPALLLAACAAVACAGEAAAHHLLAEYQILPERRVRVESWFDLGGDSPRGARVEVFRPDGSLLTSGQLDNEGLYVFSYAETEPLRVVVDAGAGHRKVLAIAAAELERTPSDSAVVPRADRSPQVSVKDVLTGLTFLLAVAAFVLSVRNARELRRLQGRS